MNIAFWFIACTFVLIALLIILPPLWRKVDEATIDDPDQRNIKIAKDRLTELKANKDSGGISEAQYEEQVAELELALSDDLELPASSSAASPNQGRWLVYVLMVAVPLMSVSLYLALGDYGAIGRSNEPAQLSQSGAEMPNPEAINKMVAALAEKMKAKPDNIEGWLMLGRSYKALERYPEAVDALAHAYQLANDKAEVLLPYAEVLALSKGNDWAGQAEDLVTKALKVEPDNPTGLWFAAMAKAQKGDKSSAVSFLKKLEAILPKDSPDRQQIHEIIVTTERQLGNPAPDESPKSAEQSNTSVNIQVSLAKELASNVNPEDTVFIYAQALSGPKMPLAIVRKKVGELPLSVGLTDADSMMPSMKLSSFKEIRLLARISKTGNAMPQAGDLIGVVEPVNVADNQKNNIVINDHVK